MAWTFGGTEGQRTLSNALIESIVYRVLSADILTGETRQGRDGTSVREDTVRGGAQMFQENCPRPTLSAPKILLVICYILINFFFFTVHIGVIRFVA